MTEYIYEQPDEPAKIVRDGWNVRVEWDFIQREEIVRCRDCKYAQDATWPVHLNIPSYYLDCLGELVETWDYYNDEPKLNPVNPNGFCAWGERRTNDIC